MISSSMSPRLLLSPTPSLSLPIPFSSHYAPQAGAAKRRYATGIGDERRRDPAWSDVSGSGGEESDEGTDEPTGDVRRQWEASDTGPLFTRVVSHHPRFTARSLSPYARSVPSPLRGYMMSEVRVKKEPRSGVRRNRTREGEFTLRDRMTMNERPREARWVGMMSPSFGNSLRRSGRSSVTPNLLRREAAPLGGFARSSLTRPAGRMEWA